VDVVTCIGRMVQHVMPKGSSASAIMGTGYQDVCQVKVVIQAALAKVEEVVKARSDPRPPDLPQRYKQSTGRDPFQCPHCGAEMAVWRIWHPIYGVIYDEGK